MNPYNFWIALLAAIIFVPILPVLYWFMNQYAPGLPPEVQILAGMVALALPILFAVSWWGA